MAFASTTVAKGRARGIVVSTGMRTQIGRIAEALGEQKTNTSGAKQSFATRVREKMMIWLGLKKGTPLQIKLNKVGLLGPRDDITINHWMFSLHIFCCCLLPSVLSLSLRLPSLGSTIRWFCMLLPSVSV